MDATTWTHAINAARDYHAIKMSYRHERGIDYDENGTIYDALPASVKQALQWLAEEGEIR